MSSIDTYAPLPSAKSADASEQDIFAFLYSGTENLPPEETVTARKSDQPGMVTVTLKTRDGRSLCRTIPVERWNEEGYRRSLIHCMAAFVA